MPRHKLWNIFFKPRILAVIILMILASCSRPSYTRQEVIDNFNKKEAEIMELAEYFRKLTPGKNEVLFEPVGNGYTITINLPGWAVHPDYPPDIGRNIGLRSAEMDTILTKLGWTTETVLTLKQKLRHINCESISTDEDYVRLHYGTSDWSSFGYVIAAKPFADSIIKRDSASGVTFLSKYARIVSSGVL